MLAKPLFDIDLISDQRLSYFSKLHDMVYHDFDYTCGHFAGHNFVSVVDAISRVLSTSFGVDASNVKSVLSEWRTRVGSGLVRTDPLQIKFDEICEIVARWKEQSNYRSMAVDLRGLTITAKYRNLVYSYITNSLSEILTNFKLLKGDGEFLIYGDAVINHVRVAQIVITVRTRYGYNLRGRIYLPSDGKTTTRRMISLNDVLGKRLCASLGLGLVREIELAAIRDEKISGEIDIFIELISIVLRYVYDVKNID